MKKDSKEIKNEKKQTLKEFIIMARMDFIMITIGISIAYFGASLIKSETFSVIAVILGSVICLSAVEQLAKKIKLD